MKFNTQRESFRWRFPLLIFLGVLTFSAVQAQKKTTETLDQIWFGYNNTIRMTSKWGVVTDLSLRTKDDFVNGWSIAILRAGLSYFLKPQTRLIAGYSFVNTFPSAPHDHISRPEHRPWQMVQWNTSYPKINISQNIRLEERYRRKVLNADALAPGYDFNFRIRYNLQAQIPIGKKRNEPGSFQWVINDEIQINAGKEIIYNYFDQNRFFTGFQYQLSKRDHLQFGFNNVFQQLSAGNSYRVIHGIRIQFMQQLDLRKES